MQRKRREQTQRGYQCCTGAQAFVLQHWLRRTVSTYLTHLTPHMRPAAMASSSVAAALVAPEVVASIDSSLELLPGVLASKENPQPLWEHLPRYTEHVRD